MGRAVGTPNKITRVLREMTLKALDNVGGVDYLETLAREEPAVFGALLRQMMPKIMEGKIETTNVVRVKDFTSARLNQLFETDPSAVKIPETDWKEPDGPRPPERKQKRKKNGN